MAKVFLTAEAYARLKAAKKEGESFSDVVLGQVKTTTGVREFLGTCKGIDAKALGAEIRKERDR